MSGPKNYAARTATKLVWLAFLRAMTTTRQPFSSSQMALWLSKPSMAPTSIARAATSWWTHNAQLERAPERLQNEKAIRETDRAKMSGMQGHRLSDGKAAVGAQSQNLSGPVQELRW